jgi:lipid A 3-O-deacylase
MKPEHKKISRYFCALLSLLLPFKTWALRAVTAEIGQGQASQLSRLALEWNVRPLWQSKNQQQQVNLYVALGLAQWRNSKPAFQAARTIFNLSITPILRWQNAKRLGWYVEAGIGANFFSHLYQNNGRMFSTKFQFGDHIGLGYAFSSGYEVQLSVQHFSNASIKRPFASVLAQYARHH